MANFKTHISTSTVIGIGYGIGAYFFWDVPVQHCVIAAGLCSVAGMLPDLDSTTGVPVRETLCFLSALIPAMMIPRFQSLGMGAEQIVFASVLFYIAFRFGVGAIFRKYTVHRGMWHSVPAAAIAGLVTFIVCLSPDFGIRLFKAWAVVMGFMTHLILDEIYSVDLSGQKMPRLKKSFGTAIKFFGNNAWGNFTTYAKLAVLVVIVMTDASVMAFFNAQPLEFERIKKLTGTQTEWVGKLSPETEEKDVPVLR